MAESNKNLGGSAYVPFFFSDDDIVEIREEDTKPGTISESFRKRVAERYGRKAPPSTNGNSEPQTDAPKT